MWPSVGVQGYKCLYILLFILEGEMNEGDENADIVTTDIINIMDKHLSIVKSAISLGTCSSFISQHASNSASQTLYLSYIIYLLSTCGK